MFRRMEVCMFVYGPKGFCLLGVVADYKFGNDVSLNGSDCQI